MLPLTLDAISEKQKRDQKGNTIRQEVYFSTNVHMIIQGQVKYRHRGTKQIPGVLGKNAILLL